MLNQHEWLSLLAPLASDEVAEKHFGKEPCDLCKGATQPLENHGFTPEEMERIRTAHDGQAVVVRMPFREAPINCIKCWDSGQVPTLAGLEAHCQIVADYLEEMTGGIDPRVAVIRGTEIVPAVGVKSVTPVFMILPEQNGGPGYHMGISYVRREYRRRVWEMLTQDCPNCDGTEVVEHYDDDEGISTETDCETCYGFGFVGTAAKWCQKCEQTGKLPASSKVRWTSTDNIHHFYNSGQAEVMIDFGGGDTAKLRPAETMVFSTAPNVKVSAYHTCRRCKGRGWYTRKRRSHRARGRGTIGDDEIADLVRSTLKELGRATFADIARQYEQKSAFLKAIRRR